MTETIENLKASLGDITHELIKVEVAEQLKGLDVPPVVDPDPEPKPDPVPTIRSEFGGPYAPWNIPARGLATHPDNDRILRNLFSVVPGKWNINSAEWTPAIFYNVGSTPKARLHMNRPEWGNMRNGDEIPWNPDWKHPADGDSYSLIIDADTGHCFEIWQTRYDRSSNKMNCGTALRILTSAHPRAGDMANVFEKENGFLFARGSGFHSAAMLGTRAEMEKGVIPHCLACSVPRPHRTRFRAPAIKAEGAQGRDGDRPLLGTRVVFDGLTDADIQTWSGRFDHRLQSHMQTIAVSIRDYGMILADHGGEDGKDYGAVQIEHTNTAKWGEIGFDPWKALTGLHSLLGANLDKARIIEEPRHVGGSSEGVAVYAGVDYPDDARYRA